MRICCLWMVTIWRDESFEWDSDDFDCIHEVRVSWMDAARDDVGIVVRIRGKILQSDIERNVPFGDFCWSAWCELIIVSISPVDLVWIRPSAGVVRDANRTHIHESRLVKSHCEIGLCPTGFKEGWLRDEARLILDERARNHRISAVECAKRCLQLRRFVVQTVSHYRRRRVVLHKSIRWDLHFQNRIDLRRIGQCARTVYTFLGRIHLLLRWEILVPRILIRASTFSILWRWRKQTRCFRIRLVSETILLYLQTNFKMAFSESVSKRSKGKSTVLSQGWEFPRD